MKLFFWFFGLVMIVLIGCMAPKSRYESNCEKINASGKYCLEYVSCRQKDIFFPCTLDTNIIDEVLKRFNNKDDFLVAGIYYAGGPDGWIDSTDEKTHRFCSSSDGITCDSLIVYTIEDSLKGNWPINGERHYYDPKTKSSKRVGRWFQ